MGNFISSKRVAVVTGGSRGIGRAVVEKLAELGDFIVVANYNLSDVSSFQSSLTDRGFLVDFFKADVSKGYDVKALVDFAVSRYGSIDVLVNNAGVSQYGLVSDVSDDEWFRVLNTNLYSCFAMCREVVPFMVSKQSGCIINISSIWGQVGASMESVYAASKGGMDAFTKSLAKELGPSHIRVNSIAPGMIMTDMNSGYSKSELDDIRGQIPLNCFGSPKDVAKCVAWLVDDCYTTRTGYSCQWWLVYCLVLV